MNILTAFQMANTVLWGLLGLVIGSFLNVCIYRIPEGRTIVKGHSMCMSCGHILGAWDLFPLFSWMFLRGKCRYCGASIASRYAKIEGFTGIVFALLAWTRRDAYILTNPSLEDLSAFGSLMILLSLASVMIVAMMIYKDHRTGMIRFPIIIFAFLAAQLVLALLQSKDVAVLLLSAALSVSTASLLVILLAVIVSSRSTSTRVFFSDLFDGTTAGTYFSLQNRSRLAMDLLYIAVSAAIGFPAAILCLITYPLFRIAGKQEKYVPYHGIVIAISALTGLIFFPNMLF
jgi:prepilin signal peptidase PulO-like enzyme (type II secretory pathway)